MSPNTVSCTSRALDTLREARRVNRKLFNRFIDSIPFISPSGSNAIDLDLPVIWDKLNTSERIAWGEANWSRLVQGL